MWSKGSGRSAASRWSDPAALRAPLELRFPPGVRPAVPFDHTVPILPFYHTETPSFDHTEPPPSSRPPKCANGGGAALMGGCCRRHHLGPEPGAAVRTRRRPGLAPGAAARTRAAGSGCAYTPRGRCRCVVVLPICSAAAAVAAGCSWSYYPMACSGASIGNLRFGLWRQCCH